MAKIFFLLVAFVLWLPASGFTQDLEAPNQAIPKAAQGGGTASPAVAPASDCVDDPRLDTDIVRIMQTDDPVIAPPITITPETYLNLDNDVIAKLAGNMVICPNNPVLKNGKTMRTISIDFPVLWEYIVNAAKKDDKDRLKNLLLNFRSKPMSPKDMLRLGVSIPLNDDKRDLLYKTAGVNTKRHNEAIDFFIFTGGKSNENAVVFIGGDFTKFGNLMEEAKKDGKTIYKFEAPENKYGWDGYKENLANVFKSAGIDAYWN